MYGDDDEDEWSDDDPRWDQVDESFWQRDPQDEYEGYEEEEEYATSDEDSDNGKWVLLEADEADVFHNASASIPEQQLSTELDAYFLGRKEKKRSFASNFGKVKLRRNYRAARQ